MKLTGTLGMGGAGGQRGGGREGGRREGEGRKGQWVWDLSLTAMPELELIYTATITTILLLLLQYYY